MGATGEIVNISLMGSTYSQPAYLVCHTDGTSSSASFASNQWYRSQSVYIKSGGVYAVNGFYQYSDERLKDFSNDISVNLDTLSKLPKKYYTWKNDTKDEYTHIGTSAQELMKVYPELVKQDEEGMLTVDYSKLSIIALKAVDMLHDENIKLKMELDKIKERLNII